MLTVTTFVVFASSLMSDEVKFPLFLLAFPHSFSGFSVWWGLLRGRIECPQEPVSFSFRFLYFDINVMLKAHSCIKTLFCDIQVYINGIILGISFGSFFPLSESSALLGIAKLLSKFSLVQGHVITIFPPFANTYSCLLEQHSILSCPLFLFLIYSFFILFLFLAALGLLSWCDLVDQDPQLFSGQEVQLLNEAVWPLSWVPSRLAGPPHPTLPAQ